MWDFLNFFFHFLVTFFFDVSGGYPFPAGAALPNDLSPNAYPQGMLHNNISPGLNNYPRMVRNLDFYFELLSSSSKHF